MPKSIQTTQTHRNLHLHQRLQIQGVQKHGENSKRHDRSLRSWAYFSRILEQGSVPLRKWTLLNVINYCNQKMLILPMDVQQHEYSRSVQRDIHTDSRRLSFFSLKSYKGMQTGPRDPARFVYFETGANFTMYQHGERQQEQIPTCLLLPQHHLQPDRITDSVVRLLSPTVQGPLTNLQGLLVIQYLRLPIKRDIILTRLYTLFIKHLL